MVIVEVVIVSSNYYILFHTCGREFGKWELDLLPLVQGFRNVRSTIHFLELVPSTRHEILSYQTNQLKKDYYMFHQTELIALVFKCVSVCEDIMV